MGIFQWNHLNNRGAAFANNIIESYGVFAFKLS